MTSSKTFTPKRILIVVVALVVIVAAFVIATQSRGQGTPSTQAASYDASVSNTLGHVELRVPDLDRSIKFYEGIGLKVSENKNGVAMLTVQGGGDPLLGLIEDQNAALRPNDTTGLFHLAILLPTRADLALTLDHISKSGYPIQGASDHQYSEAMYLTDPDNNGIEIYADRDSSKWKEDSKGGYIGGTASIDFKSLMSEIKSKTWSGLPAGTKLGHMHLQASELKDSEDFYTKGLGFDVVAKGNGMLFLSKDRYHHHIGLNTWSGVGIPQPPANSLGMNLFTVRFSPDEFEQAQANLKGMGHAFDLDGDAFTVKDPSGNTLRVTNNK